MEKLQRPTYSITSKGGPALHPVLPVSANETHDGLLKILEEQLPNLLKHSDYEAPNSQDQKIDEDESVEFDEVMIRDS
ncbi:hypothetical protein PGT21_000717 [Puccinia graminis f. sp. tritici]|uniref:Uncharacterized protein n=1 Tax=Puccinia graminis f. sp. tritici TaxID=56615 RepID=A0A5B0QEQ3_PUCGR|nr:hypothetical protein PGT21_000717 [Puccinia graminis f. sp. tritici]